MALCFHHRHDTQAEGVVLGYILGCLFFFFFFKFYLNKVTDGIGVCVLISKFHQIVLIHTPDSVHRFVRYIAGFGLSWVFIVS